MIAAAPVRVRVSPVPVLSVFAGRRFAILVVAFGIVSVVFMLLLVFLPIASRNYVTGIFQLGSMLLTLGNLAWAIRRSPPGRIRWAWIAMAVAILAYVAALIILTIIGFTTTISGPVPKPPVVDALFLAFYPLFAMGIAFIPSIQDRVAQRLQVFLDSGIVIFTLFSLSLVFLILPRIDQFARLGIAATLYPFADFALLIVIIIMFSRGVNAAYRPVFLWLAFGMLTFVYADSALSLVSFNDPSYPGGSPFIDPFWVISAFCISLAVLYFLVHGETRPARTDQNTVLSGINRILSFDRLSYALLYVPVIISFGLISFQLLSDYNTSPFALPLLLTITFIEIILIITRQIVLTQDLIRARLEITQAQELDSIKDTFITSINHELRTPMMTMQGYIELLGENEVQLAPQARLAMIERARRANGALVHLLEGILDTRRIEQEAKDFALEEVTVQQVIYQAIELIDPYEAASTERELQLQIDPHLVVWGEPIRLQQVFSNLLSNAVKYSPPGSPIIVNAKPLKALQGGRKRRTNGVSPDMVEITVQDQGLGIPPEQIPLLFNRFVRLPRDMASKVRGTGLGLYLCRSFITAMGGEIWVESSGVPGEGSTFHVRLAVPFPSEKQAAGTAAR